MHCKLNKKSLSGEIRLAGTYLAYLYFDRGLFVWGSECNKGGFLQFFSSPQDC